MNTLEKEIEKYEAIWSLPAYHEVSPGEKYAAVFEEVVEDKSCAVIDIGCGAGAGGKALQELGYRDMTFLDLVRVSEDTTPFIHTPIWRDWQVPKVGPGKRWDWGYCCDVLEHIPPEYSALSIHRIRENCSNAFLSIGLTPDHFGKVIRDELHLNVKPFRWWKELLSEFGEVLDARDQLETGVYVVKF